MKNTNYAILNSNTNEFEYAEDIIIVGNRKITNPSKEHYLKNGYLEVLKEEQPTEEDYSFTEILVNKNGIPVQSWQKHKNEELTEPDYE